MICLAKVSSNEPITGRKLYNDPARITNYARLASSTNIFPEEIEATHGSMERYLFVHFKKTLTKEEQNPHLGEEIISTEMSGIFNWVLEGLERITKEKKFTEAEDSIEMFKQFKESVDIVEDFLNESEYISSTTQMIRLTELFKEFKIYCDDNGFHFKGDSRALNKMLKNKNFKCIKSGSGGYYNVFIEKKKNPIVNEVIDFFTKNDKKDE